MSECSFYSFILQGVNAETWATDYAAMPIHLPSSFPKGPALQETVDLVEQKTGGTVKLIVEMPHPVSKEIQT